MTLDGTVRLETNDGGSFDKVKNAGVNDRDPCGACLFSGPEIISLLP